MSVLPMMLIIVLAWTGVWASFFNGRIGSAMLFLGLLLISFVFFRPKG